MNEFISDIGIGIVIGLAIGLSIGIILGKRQKPWSEMTKEEKRIHKIIIGIGVVLLSIGVLVNIWFFYNW